jgi:hypothetical protein
MNMNEIKYPILKIISAKNRGTVFVLKKKRYTCGRSESNDIVLSDSSTSSNHCELLKSGGTYTIHDTDSANGTSVNDILVDEKALINNDIIKLGSVELLYDADIGEDISEGKSTVGARTGINLNLYDNETSSVNEMKNISPFAVKSSKNKNKMPQFIITTIIVSLALTVVGLLIWLLVIFYL